MNELNGGLRNRDCGTSTRRRRALSFFNPHSASRNGLAPLELVIATPLLMMVMALMIIFGNAAYWKVRGLSVARNAAWSNRWPRNGTDEPTPSPWAPGNFSQRGGPVVDVLDHPSLQHAVVRGPLPKGFEVNTQFLEPKQAGSHRGSHTRHVRAGHDAVAGFLHL
jgi:hypothetical protein